MAKLRKTTEKECPQCRSRDLECIGGVEKAGHAELLEHEIQTLERDFKCSRCGTLFTYCGPPE